MLNQRHLLIRVQEECCPKPLLLWWCAVLTPGHYLIGTAGGVLPKGTTVVLVSCSHTKTLFHWDCWWCVGQMGDAGGVLSKSTIGVVGCSSHTMAFFDWGCWCCVVQGHYWCGGVQFSHEDIF